MAQPLVFILMSTLFYKVNSLTCYQCIPETSIKCTETKVECPVGQCGTMRTTSYMGNNTLADMIMKNCSATHQCVTATANFGITRLVINNQCCNTNLCNTQTEIKLPKTTPNGIHCFTCNGEDCAATLPCVDEEDHCIKATVNSDGLMMTMRGCATESFCRGDLSTQIGQSSKSSQSSQSSIAADQSCCKGHLCNSAQTATASRFFQLGILIYAILQMSF